MSHQEIQSDVTLDRNKIKIKLSIMKNSIFIIFVISILFLGVAGQTAIASAMVLIAVFSLFLGEEAMGFRNPLFFAPFSGRFSALNEPMLLISIVMLPLAMMYSYFTGHHSPIEILKHYSIELVTLGALMSAYGLLATIASGIIVEVITTMRKFFARMSGNGLIGDYITLVLISLLGAILGEVVVAKSLQMVFGEEHKISKHAEFCKSLNALSAIGGAWFPLGTPAGFIAYSLVHAAFPEMGYMMWMSMVFIPVFVSVLVYAGLMLHHHDSLKRYQGDDGLGNEEHHSRKVQLTAIGMKISIIVFHLVGLYSNSNMIHIIEIIAIWGGILYFCFLEKCLSSWTAFEEKKDDIPLMFFLASFSAVATMIDPNLISSLAHVGGDWNWISMNILATEATRFNDNAFVAVVLSEIAYKGGEFLFIMTMMSALSGSTIRLSNAHVAPSLDEFQRRTGIEVSDEELLGICNPIGAIFAPKKNYMFWIMFILNVAIPAIWAWA